MMLKCIIVDDEILALDLLEDYIKNVPFLQLIKRCTNAMEALAVIQQEQIDLVFSDIQMQGLNGLQLIKTLTVKPMFIMVSAYHSYAIEGYELDVIDYLLKPVSYERFVKAANKALAQHNLLQKNRLQVDHIFLHVDYSLLKVMVDEIRYLEAVKDYVKIHYTNDRKPLLIRTSMKAMEELLPEARFYRIHKSYIVHFNQITAIRKNSLFLHDLELPVSEQYKEVIAQLTHRSL